MKFHKKDNVLCFSKEELCTLYRISALKNISDELEKHGMSISDLMNNFPKTVELSKTLGERWAEDRDHHEVIVALFGIFGFYKAESDVCFEMRSEFDPNKDKINSLEDLIRFRNTQSMTDFMILSEDGIRKFQLKRYKGNLKSLNAQAIFEFIKDKLLHYGNDLDDTNLLILLQSDSFEGEAHVDFKELHNKIGLLNLKFSGHVLINFHQENKKEEFIVQVYPGLTKKTIPLRFPSDWCYERKND